MPVNCSSLLLLTASCLFCCRPGFTQDEWVGRRVYHKLGSVAKIDDKLVQSDGLFNVPETVEAENEEWAFLGQGWMLKRDLMNVDEAFQYYDEIVRKDPNAIAARVGRASSASDKGDFERAIQDFDYAIRQMPMSSPLYTGRAVVRNASKDFNGAIRDCEQAIAFDPMSSSAYFARAFANYSLGRAKEALADYDTAIKLNPTDAELYAERSSLKYFQGDLAGAIEDSSEAIQLDSKCFKALNSLAWIYATEREKRNGDLAVKMATKACELTHFRNSHTLGTLAAAYAETGDFSAAVKFLVQANELDPNSGTEFRQKMLKSFQAQEPFRN